MLMRFLGRCPRLLNLAPLGLFKQLLRTMWCGLSRTTPHTFSRKGGKKRCQQQKRRVLTLAKDATRRASTSLSLWEMTTSHTMSAGPACVAKRSASTLKRPGSVGGVLANRPINWSKIRVRGPTLPPRAPALSRPLALSSLVSFPRKALRIHPLQSAAKNLATLPS